MPETIGTTREAREQHIAIARVQQRKRLRTSRSLKRASFVPLASEYIPDINYSAHLEIALVAMDKICQYCQAVKFRSEKSAHLEKLRCHLFPHRENHYYRFLLAAGWLQLILAKDEKF